MAEKKRQGSGSLAKRLARVDSELLRLLAERSDLFDRHLRERKSQGQSLSDPEMEKGLWKSWQQENKQHGLNEKLLRRVFYLVNGLAYDRVERPAEREFLLRPRREQADIDVRGPGDCQQSRLWIALAAASGSALQLEGVLMNDSLFDMIRALHQAGLRVQREGASVWIPEATPPAEFNGRSLYVGGDLLNLYLLVFMATLRPGSCKLTGDTVARLADLGALFDLLPRLGARGVSLLPGNKGLPMRLESSGAADEIIRLPDEAPAELGMALTLCAGFFHAAERGMRLEWSEGSGWGQVLEPATRVLAECGAGIDPESAGLSVHPGKMAVPPQPGLPLDAELSSYLLAVPRFVGGRCRLRGELDLQSERGALFARVLESGGLELEADEEAVFSRPGEQGQQEIALDLGTSARAVPLAVSLALAAGGGELGLPGDDSLDFAQEMLDRLGADASLRDGVLKVASGPARSEEKVELAAPDPGWGLALCLISLLRPGIVLQNPGELYGVWPEFWTLYNGLPRPQQAIAAKEEKRKEGHGGKRRRIYVT